MIDQVIKRKKGVLTLAFVLVCILCGFSVFGYIQKHVEEGRVKTDKKTIIKLVPELTNIEKCYWKIKTLSENSLLSPGPSRAAIYAYVKIKDNDFSRIIKAYEWRDVRTNFTRDFTPLEYAKSNTWVYSEEFDEAILPHHEYAKFYLEPNLHLIYFEIQQ